MKRCNRFNLVSAICLLMFSCIGTVFSSWKYRVDYPKDTEYSRPGTQTYPQACLIDGSSKTYYSSFTTALSAANAITNRNVEVKFVIKTNSSGALQKTTLTISNDITINSNVTVTLPYFNDDDSTCLYKKLFDSNYGDTTAYDSLHASSTVKNPYGSYSSYVILSVTIASGYTLTNNGTLNIGGRQNGSGGGNMAGQTYGGAVTSSNGTTSPYGSTAYFAELVLAGNAKYVSNGKTVCFGYIKGTATTGKNPAVEFYSGSKTYLPFCVIEHRGGTTFSGLSSVQGSPFNRLFFPNIMTVDTYYYGSSELWSIPDLYASSHANRCFIKLLGPDSSFLLCPKVATDSAFYLHNYYSFKSVTYTNTAGTSKTVSIPRHTLNIYGSFDVNYMTLSVSIVKLSTSKCYFPISCYYDITLNKMPGSSFATVNSAAQKIKILPGASLKISEGVIANLVGVANYYGDDANYSRYGKGDKFDGIEGNNGAALYEMIDCDGKLIINGELSADYLSGIIYTETNTSVVNVNNNTDTLYEVNKSSNSFWNFTMTAQGVIYNVDGYSTIQANSTYHGDIDHWDGNGATYPLIVTNLHTGSTSFDENLIENNSYQSTISSSVSLPTPNYTNPDDPEHPEYTFVGYFCEPEFINAIVPGNSSAGAIGNAFDLTNHEYHIYARWVESNAEKATYRVDKYDGNSTVTQGEVITVLIGDSYNTFEVNRKPTSFTSSKIDTYEYNGWTAKIYADSTASTLVTTKHIDDGGTFDFTNSNDVYDGNFVVFEPDYIHTSVNAPSISVSTSTTTLPTNGSSTLTAIVNNFRPDIYDYIGLFAVESDDDVSVTTNENYTISGSTITYTGTATNKNDSGSDNGSVTIYFGFVVSVTIDGVSYSSSDNSLYKGSVNQGFKYSSSCLLADSKVMLADGTYKLAKDLTINDRVITFNHLTGQYEANNIAFVTNDEGDYNVIYLTFEGGIEMKVATGHGFFNYDHMKYEIYYGEEFKEHIGERFISTDYVDGQFISKPVRLLDAKVVKEHTVKYSPISSYQINLVADNMLSIPDDVEGMFDMYEYDENLKIKIEPLSEILSEYGLWTYDEFKEYSPEYAFDIMNVQYLKAALLTGSITVEKINHLLEVYLPMIVEQNNLEWDCEHQKYLPDNIVEILRSQL